MRLQEARRDLYRRLAKEQGYRSRAAFKLIEANGKYRFIRAGDRIIDFGAAPGGWLQVCSRITGDSGTVVGLDLRPIHFKSENVKLLQLDVYDESVAGQILRILPRQADVILSDLSPSVSGIWDLDHFRQVEMTLRVLSLGESLLRIGGSAFFKLFEGERSGELKKELSRRFQSVKVMKPQASRRESSELYYVCLGWRDRGAAPRTADAPRTASATAA